MRRLNDTRHDDSGVATIFVIIAMTSILAGAALAIDVGGYVATARSAQSSADGTVLAVAADCVVEGKPVGDYTIYRKDGQKINDLPGACDSDDLGPYATITVTDQVDGLLLLQSAGEVDRTATARWSTITRAKTLPVITAKCEFDKYPVGETTDIIIHFPDPKKQTGCTSGPGGFGQLDGDDDDDPCTVDITVPGDAPGQPGNSFVKEIECIPELPAEILIPVFDETKCPEKGCQGNELYPVIGFAVFRLTGYSFQQGDGGVPTTCDKDIGKNCIRGDFIETTTSQGTPGPSGDFGVQKVYLYS